MWDVGFFCGAVVFVEGVCDGGHCEGQESDGGGFEGLAVD